MLNVTIESLDRLLAALRDFPERLERESLAGWELKTQINNLETDIRERQYTYEFDVRQEMGDNGKPKYGNEAAREV